MYKIGIMFAVLVSGVYASENPFAIEQNLKQIDQEENMLVREIEKEQAAREKEEDALFDDEASEEEKADAEAEIKEEVQIVEVETDVEPKSQEEQNKTEEVPTPAEVPTEVATVEKETQTVEKDKVAEVTDPVVTTKEPEVSTEEKVSPESELQEPKKEAEAVSEPAEPKKEVIPAPKTEEPKEEVAEAKEQEAQKSEPAVVTPAVTPEVQAPQEPVATEEPIDIKIREVDAKIKKLEENLDASKRGELVSDAGEKSTTVEAEVKTDTSVKDQDGFETELHEAVESVR